MGDHSKVTDQDGDNEVNLVRYEDKDGEDNYVIQFKTGGKETSHFTRHADGSVWQTKAGGKAKKI